MVLEYNLVVIYFILILFVSVAISVLSISGVYQKWSREKITPYECGFDPYGDARTQFDVHFYLVFIVFIIFDLEVVFLFPWALVLGSISYFGFNTMFFSYNIIFLLIIPAIIIIVLSFIPFYEEVLIKQIALVGSGGSFIYSIFIWLDFRITASYMQYKVYGKMIYYGY